MANAIAAVAQIGLGSSKLIGGNPSAGTAHNPGPCQSESKTHAYLARSA